MGKLCTTGTFNLGDFVIIYFKELTVPKVKVVVGLKFGLIT